MCGRLEHIIGSRITWFSVMQFIKNQWIYSKKNIKPGLQVQVPVAKGSKAEKERIKKIVMLGKLFDEASDPRLAPSTQLNKLYIVRRGYIEAGFVYLEKKTTRLIESIRKKVE